MTGLNGNTRPAPTTQNFHAHMCIHEVGGSPVGFERRGRDTEKGRRDKTWEDFVNHARAQVHTMSVFRLPISMCVREHAAPPFEHGPRCMYTPDLSRYIPSRVIVSPLRCFLGNCWRTTNHEPPKVDMVGFDRSQPSPGALFSLCLLSTHPTISQLAIIPCVGARSGWW